MATHKSNIALWSGFFVSVLFCYHLFSDGDFSFLMVRLHVLYPYSAVVATVLVFVGACCLY